MNVTHPEKGVTMKESSSGLKGWRLGGGVLGGAAELQRTALPLTPATTTARILKGFGVESLEGSTCSFAMFPQGVLGKFSDLSELSFSSYKMGIIMLNLQDVCNNLNISISMCQTYMNINVPICLGIYRILDTLYVSGTWHALSYSSFTTTFRYRNHELHFTNQETETQRG